MKSGRCIIKLFLSILFLELTQTNLCQAQTSSSAQNKTLKIFSLSSRSKIIQASIIDTALQDAISNFINEEMQTDTTFRKYGYLKLVQKVAFKDGKEKCCFHLSKSFYYFYSDFEDARFPLFYTIIENKLILIYLSSFSELNRPIKRKSKKKFINLVNSRLPKIERQVIIMGNEKKILRPVGTPVIDSKGTDICIPCNSSQLL